MSEIKIALTGKLRSGKSTAACHLISQGFSPVSFGASLKHYADILFEHSPVYKSEPIEKDDPFGGKMTTGKRKPRRLYQDFGEKMRELDPNIWIQHAEARVGDAEFRALVDGLPARIVIDDLRQPNEYEWARVNGFTIIRVNASDEVRVERAKAAGDDFSEEDLRHKTEQYVDGFEADFDVWNDGIEQAELERKIDEIIRSLQVGI